MDFSILPIKGIKQGNWNNSCHHLLLKYKYMAASIVFFHVNKFSNTFDSNENSSPLKYLIFWSTKNILSFKLRNIVVIIEEPFFGLIFEQNVPWPHWQNFERADQWERSFVNHGHLIEMK